MTDPSTTCAPATSPPIRNATSSPASAGGPMHSSSPDGPDLSGPAVALANLSPQQAKARGLLTSGISGPVGSTSSASAVLQSSLASRLRQRLDSGGGMLFRLTWKMRVTPAGRPICALRASGHRTSGSGCGSWPTAQAQDWKGLQGRSYKGTSTDLPTAALSAWPTPTTRDHKDGTFQPHVAENCLLGRQVWQVGWNTPRATDGSHGGPNQANGALSADAVLTSGIPLSGSPAETPNSGRLNPAFSRWLMGYPPEWDDCAVTAMPSSRRSPRPSSVRT